MNKSLYLEAAGFFSLLFFKASFLFDLATTSCVFGQYSSVMTDF